MGTKNYVVDDRCIVPPEIKMLSAAELAEKIAEYVQDLPPLKQNETEIKLPEEYKMMTEYPSDIRVYGRDWQ